MEKIIGTKINRFDGGIAQDPRADSASSSLFISHCDVFAKPSTIVPLRDLEANETKSFSIVKFIQTNSQIYGLGVVSGTSRVKIFQKDGDIITGGWTESNSGESSSGARSEDVFFHYKNYIYGFKAGTTIWRYGDITSSPSFTDSYQSVSYTTLAQPVHHAADDSAYFFADNIVYRLDNTTWDGAVLTLPSDVKIVSATAYGNYLAIGCTSKDLTGGSTVFLWDRDSSLATISEKVDWGEGAIGVLGVIEGTLFGISEFGGGSSSGSFGLNPKIRVKYLSGSTPLLLKEIDISSEVTGNVVDSKLVPGSSVVNDDKLFFAIEVGSNAVPQNYTGIWVLGRSNVGAPFSVSLKYKVDTDGDADTIDGFNIFGDYVFVAHSSDGSVDRTNDQSSYTQTTIYEKLFITDNPHTTKKLLGVTVTTEPLPTAGQVVLKYKKDEDSSFTTIFTNTTDNSLRQSAVVDASGATFPHYKQITFRIESTGGAEITGLYFREEIIEDDIYG